MNENTFNVLMSAIDQRVSSRKNLSDLEIGAIKLLLQKCAPEYNLDKKTIKTKPALIPLGEKSDKGPINPFTGYLYEGDTKEELENILSQEEWCGQFAGEGQWLKLGRVAHENQLPSFQRKIYGKYVSIYAYEQTKPI